MAAIKSFTDLSQSKTLSTILPVETADMYYYTANGDLYKTPNVIESKDDLCVDENSVPCWSLAALLEALPKIVNHETLFIETSAVLWHIGYRNIYTARADNLVDTCYEMIIKLHELKML